MATWRRRKVAAGLVLASSLAVGCLAGPRHRRVVASSPVATQTQSCTCANSPTAACASSASSTSSTALEPTVATITTEPDPKIESSSNDASLGAGPDASTSVDPTLVMATGNAPALTYAALDGAACEQQLKKRGIPYSKVTTALGVDRPVRLTGKLHGVDFHGLGAKSQLATSVYEIVDCRLVLALDDFAAILEKHDVIEAIHMSIYRPAKAKKPGQKPHSQHEGALAIDLGTLVKSDGTKLSVLDDFHGAIGVKKTCGPGSGPSPATKPALELRALLCEASDQQLFNVMLTPNYNKPHQNHFHLEITRGVKWFLLH